MKKLWGYVAVWALAVVVVGGALVFGVMIQ